jgi:uncharacterized protein YbcI
VSEPDPGGRPGLPAEISNSLALVWKRYAGRRPTDVETVVNGTKVACVLRDSVKGFDHALTPGQVDDDGEPLPVRTISGYKQEAIEAVAKATRQRVVAFVSNHDADSDVAKEVFILERPPRRRSSIFLDHRQEDRRPATRGE